MSRYDLTDLEWRVIEPLLPNKPRGVTRVDDRRVLPLISMTHARRSGRRGKHPRPQSFGGG